MGRTRKRPCSRGESYYPRGTQERQEEETNRRGFFVGQVENQEQEHEEEEEEEQRNEQDGQTENGVTIDDHDVLDCYICFQPLHPSFRGFTSCNLGHVACPICVTKLSGNCQVCTGPIGNTRMIALEKILEASKIFCPNKLLGCPARIPYYQKTEHETSCPYCPCFCPEVSCNFSSSPKLLLEHAQLVHKLLVNKIEYGVAFCVFISDSFRFKVLEDREERMFLLSTIDIGHGKQALSLVCVRAPGLSEPEFSYKLTIERVVSDASSSNRNQGRKVEFSEPVRNSTLGERMSCDGPFLIVLDSGASKKFIVSVCIKVCCPGELKQEVA